MLTQTVIIFSTFMACFDSATIYKPIFINGVDSQKKVVTVEHNFNWPMNEICENAKTEAGVNWLPSTSINCSYKEEANSVHLEVLKYVNVYEEKQIIQGKNGVEKVYELREVSKFSRSPTEDGKKKVKGSVIWATLGLNDSDILRTHKDPSKGKVITFDSLEEFVIEKLHILYVSKKDETAEETNKPAKQG